MDGIIDHSRFLQKQNIEITVKPEFVNKMLANIDELKLPSQINSQEDLKKKHDRIWIVFWNFDLLKNRVKEKFLNWKNGLSLIWNFRNFIKNYAINHRWLKFQGLNQEGLEKLGIGRIFFPVEFREPNQV